jgi:hypothetical protein
VNIRTNLAPPKQKKKLKQKKKENWLQVTNKILTKQKNLCDKKSAQKNLVVHKQKTTTLSSTKLRSKKLIGVGKKGVYKKAWMRTTKVDRVATPPSPYPHIIPHTIATTIVSYYKTTTRCPTLCSFPPIVNKKIVDICAKKSRYLRVLGAKKRVVI